MADEEEKKEKTDQLGRKIWDKEEFRKRAAEKDAEDARDTEDLDGPPVTNAKKRRKEPDWIPPHLRKDLQVRESALNLEADIGKRKLVTSHTVKQMQGGFWCTVCECLLKDSQSYLDHINGRRHNQFLGMHMKVERSSVDQVKARLAALKKKNAVEISEEDIEARLEHLNDEEEEKKRRRKEKKKARKQAAQAGASADAVCPPAGEGEEEAEAEFDGPSAEELEMLAAMGLPTGFG